MPRSPRPRKPKAPPEVGWCVYLVECRDGSLYAGATNRLLRRVAKHDAGKGARYTRSRRPVKLVWWESAADKSAALSREARIKQLSRAEKLALVAAPTCSARPSRKPASAARTSRAARAGRGAARRT
ncbi:MAG TPA: GIY-YIG nuclease family protein [Myxococcales bacterium]